MSSWSAWAMSVVPVIPTSPRTPCMIAVVPTECACLATHPLHGVPCAGTTQGEGADRAMPSQPPPGRCREERCLVPQDPSCIQATICTVRPSPNLAVLPVFRHAKRPAPSEQAVKPNDRRPGLPVPSPWCVYKRSPVFDPSASSVRKR
jgi:hypothetical protein